MLKVLSVFAAMLALAFVMQFTTARAADEGGTSQKVTGILIDNACGSGMVKKDDPEAAAAKHSRSCAMKKSCEKSGYAVISGKKLLKFDDNGNKLAKDFLANSDKDNDLRVTVEGTVDGNKIAVTSLKAAPDKQ
jgi:hypothetical protein